MRFLMNKSFLVLFSKKEHLLSLLFVNKKKQKNRAALRALARQSIFFWPGALLLPTLAACSVGPHYHRPAPTPNPSPADFKELQGWKPADGVALPSGNWWEIYNDPTLNALEAKVAISNQTIAEDAANYRYAEALVTEARANLFPILSGSFAASRSQSATGSGGNFSGSGGSFSSGPTTTLTPEVSASWTADIWGQIRHQVEEAKQTAAEDKANLAYATLSAQATLASDYFELRSSDSLRDIYRQTADADQRAYEIARSQYNAGTVTSADMVTAQAQVDAARAALAGVESARAMYEHAIAVLSGDAPAAVTIPPAPLTAAVPVVPAGVPSELLERRPDIAAAEHVMHAQNEAIGVAVAALYPTITLSADGGFSGNALNNLFNVAHRFWSLGANGAVNIFDGGAQTAAIQAARANYDGAVADYRETVLTAFQGVEDQLAALHALQNQIVFDDSAVRDAQKALEVTLNQYKAGTVNYTSVVTEEDTLLSAQQSQLTTQTDRLVASVTLVEDLGGGWQR